MTPPARALPASVTTGADVHEAGHAVVCLVRGGWVTGVSLDPPAIRWVSGTLSPRDDIAATLAGERALVGWGLLDTGERAGCGEDVATATELAVALTGDEASAQQLLAELRAEVDEELLEHLGALGRIAVALLERGHLDGAELLRLFLGIDRDSSRITEPEGA